MVGFGGIVINGGFKGTWVYTFSKIFQSIKLSKLRVGHKKLSDFIFNMHGPAKTDIITSSLPVKTQPR